MVAATISVDRSLAAASGRSCTTDVQPTERGGLTLAYEIVTAI